MNKDYAGIATQYARDVVDGRIAACKWVRLACARHLRDLERAGCGPSGEEQRVAHKGEATSEIRGEAIAPAWRYCWNPLLTTKAGKEYRPADRICHFAELLPHIKGDWADRGEAIELQPWQVFILASVFGWIDRDSITEGVLADGGARDGAAAQGVLVRTGKRRFRIADLFVPRKNAKSTIAAVIGLYMLGPDEEFGAEVYSGATSEKQAGEVFKPARTMAERTPQFRARYGVDVFASNISIPQLGSKFEPVIGKPGDGASPSCAIVDEYHEHPNEDLYDTMRTGMGARSQPLLLVITTAGDDISGPCYAHQVDLQQVLEGAVEDERRFGIIYTIDQVEDEEGKTSGDDWTSEAALVKANPNFAVSIDREFLLAAQAEAVRDARKQATFKTKHLNLWVNAGNPWLNLEDWKRAADPELKLEQFKGEAAWPGLDLSNTIDIASRCLIFKRRIEGEDHYYVFWRHYLPEAIIQDPENRHYLGWKSAGWITETPGGMIDHDRIRADLVADSKLVRISEVALDQWGAAGISAEFEREGFTVVGVPMNVKHLSAPMKWIDALLKTGRLHHNGDPVAAWGVSNVSVKPDHNDNWFPRRGARKRKIDPALALVVGMNRAMLGDATGDIEGWLKNPVAVG